jgi:hypothetical protein
MENRSEDFAAVHAAWRSLPLADRQAVHNPAAAQRLTALIAPAPAQLTDGAWLELRERLSAPTEAVAVDTVTAVLGADLTDQAATVLGSELEAPEDSVSGRSRAPVTRFVWAGVEPPKAGVTDPGYAFPCVGCSMSQISH